MDFTDRYGRAVRNSTFGKEMRQPIADSVELIRDNRERRVDKIKQFHDKRVNSAEITKLTGRNEYYRLTFTRVNGE